MVPFVRPRIGNRSDTRLPASRPGPGAAGFTLVEVMIALTVSAVLVSIVYGIIAGISVNKDRLERDGESFHQARTIFSHMGREIRSLHLPPENIVFRGGRDPGGYYFLELVTAAVSPVLPRSTGISQVRYEMRPDSRNGTAAPMLVRSEKTLLPGSEDGGMEHRLARGVAKFSLRFFDGDNWRDEWDAAEQNLPRLIELSLEIEADGVRLPFITAFEIPRV